MRNPKIQMPDGRVIEMSKSQQEYFRKIDAAFESFASSHEEGVDCETHLVLAMTSTLGWAVGLLAATATVNGRRVTPEEVGEMAATMARQIQAQLGHLPDPDAVPAEGQQH